MCSRLHNQRRRIVLVHFVYFEQIVGSEFSQILARDHAFAGQQERKTFVHALEAQEVFRRLGLVDFLLLNDGLGQQYVTCATAQLLYDVLVKLFDLDQLRGRHIGDFLDR